MSLSSTDWDDVVKKEARGNNDEDLGEVQEVGQNYKNINIERKTLRSRS